MDSMKNLDKSLPGSTPRHKKRAPAPPEDLLQSFKSAALSVTNLYKRAAEELGAERQAGYQDAVYDLLSYLDKHDIGLETGEGWKVRQWATERQEEGPSNLAASDEDDEGGEERDEGGQSVEEEDTKTPETPSERETPKAGPQEKTTEETTLRSTKQTSPVQPPRAENFTFQASHPYPEMDVDSGHATVPRQQASHTKQTAVARLSRKHNQPSRNGSRTRQLGLGAGSKRKVQLNDFFDLGSLTFGKDSFGGGSKKARQI